MNILTYGTFDLFHEGHEKLLSRARRMGELLYVGLSTAEFCQLKGKAAPVQDWETRRDAVMRYADIVFPEDHWEQKKSDIHRYAIDRLVMGDDWRDSPRFSGLPCEMVFLPRTPNISTTKIRQGRNLA